MDAADPCASDEDAVLVVKRPLMYSATYRGKCFGSRYSAGNSPYRNQPQPPENNGGFSISTTKNKIM